MFKKVFVSLLGYLFSCLHLDIQLALNNIDLNCLDISGSTYTWIFFPVNTTVLFGLRLAESALIGGLTKVIGGYFAALGVVSPRKKRIHKAWFLPQILYYPVRCENRFLDTGN